METNINIPAKDTPVMVDRVIQELQDKLKANLSWLDYAFGRAYRLTTHEVNGEKFSYPACYMGNGEYMSMLPNDKLGNFSWFDIFDPQVLDTSVSTRPRLKLYGSLVFWYDQSKIYEDSSSLHTEEIKNEVVRLLTTPGLISYSGRISVENIYERFENIYKGYTIERIYNDSAFTSGNSVDKRFFMYPYAGLRIEFNIITQELCR